MLAANGGAFVRITDSERRQRGRLILRNFTVAVATNGKHDNILNNSFFFVEEPRLPSDSGSDYRLRETGIQRNIRGHDLEQQYGTVSDNFFST